jgi:deoxyribodipyrimidine photo-lyase
MSKAIVWFRQDLRLADNPALAAALQGHDQILPVFIHEPADSGWSPGAASKWWLHHALVDLSAALEGRLLIRSGQALKTLRGLVAASGAEAVYWNRCYEPAAIERDTQVKQALRADGVRVDSHNAGLMFEPWTVANRQGLPFRVFTPFWKHLLSLGLPSQVLPEPDLAGRLTGSGRFDGSSIDALGLLPSLNWASGIAAAWRPDRASAQARLDEFAASKLAQYDSGRDRPGQDGVSRLSPYLHFGQLGPREVVAALGAHNGLAMPYLRELGWREFAHYQLYHFPHTTDAPLDRRFERFPWRDSAEDLVAWQRGQTGIPMVDAGMRQLWSTGWMHNRVRMVVASFLVKNLLLPWQEGARWFWDTLVDADLASNSMGWQWVAGSGADAAPYFRVFNPVLQGQKFDPEGNYVRQWVPELSRLPKKWIHCPWDAPLVVLQEAGVHLGDNYPAPIVDLKASRNRALEAWAMVKSNVEKA